ncbi:STAS domain-containing protein [Streptomyces sp. NPDC020983]|uniref:STAS domain-containing protein n=1 Tax=Streptomyces sp. NPDC020983 TaxID=3365106 RepID=UPI00378785AE
MKITTRTTPSGPVVTVAGDLDYETAGDLRSLVTALVLQPGQHLVLDLGAMEFCDSSGITALIVARNHAQAARAHILLTAVPANTLRLLRVSGLDRVFRVEAADGPAGP